MTSPVAGKHHDLHNMENKPEELFTGLEVECSLEEKYGEEEEEIEIIHVETQSKNPDDLVCFDKTVSRKIFGDLNQDDEDDCVIITKQTEEYAFVKEEDRGGILIAFNKEEYYETALAIPDCFSLENEDGGVYFASELSVSIGKNNLKIYYGHGRCGWWQHLFRYRNSDFELIGYDRSESRGLVTESVVSINFLAKKKKTLTNTNPEAESGEEVFDEFWQDIELTSGTVKLTDIINFDEFSVEVEF